MKMLSHSAILAGLAFWSPLASAQTFSLYKFVPKNPAELDRIATQHEIVGRHGDIYDVYVKLPKTKQFQQEIPQARLVAADADAEWKQKFHTDKQFVAGYHNWQTVQDYMASTAVAYPDLASVATYGKSNQGNELKYLRISSKAARDANKPKIFLDAATHGDEIITVEVLIALTDELLKGYSKDPRLTKILDETDIYISYVVNPDGYRQLDRYDNDVDPNRSYPWPEQPNRTPTMAIKSLMDLYAKEQFQGSITFHAYGRMLMYPWAYSKKPLEDVNDRMTFDTLADKLAEGNGYTHGPIATTIYIAKGSSADYYYWKHKTTAFAVELTTTKAPAVSQIPNVVNEAREMTWGFLEHFQQ